MTGGRSVLRPHPASRAQYRQPMQRSGWYVTDYAKKPAGGAANSESSDGKGDTSKDSTTKKDSKPKAETGSKVSEKKS